MFKEKKNYIVDYLIVGQGLAGSCMALQLLTRGKHIMVIDNPHPNTSSMVAAGIFNPITGRRMVKTWRAEDLFPYLYLFYQQAEKELQSHFLNILNIYRPFADLEEQNQWMGKSTSEENQYWIEKVHYRSKYPMDLLDEYGGLEVKNCGYVDLPLFINSVRSRLKERGCYTQNIFDENKLTFQENSVSYEGLEAKKIIICNGINGANSTLFGWLPYHLVKGEILEISVPELPKVIYNRGVFILPKSGGRCRVGATYEHNDLTWNATEKAKKVLVEKLNKLYCSSYNIVDQLVGIRPATKDRRPFIGIHPKYRQVGILNGLGAKGVSLAPYFSKQFVEMLENGGKLDNEVDISRYKSLYYSITG